MIPFVSGFRTCKTNPRWKYQKSYLSWRGRVGKKYKGTFWKDGLW